MRCGRAGFTTAAVLWCRTASGTEDFGNATGYGAGRACAAGTAATTFTRSTPAYLCNYTDERLAELDARNIPYGGGLYTRYEITQMQRALERRVRKYKRRYLAEATAGVDASQSAAKLKAARQQLSAFLEETRERLDGARAEVPGFGQAKQADEAASALQSVQNNATLKAIRTTRRSPPKAFSASSRLPVRRWTLRAAVPLPMPTKSCCWRSSKGSAWNRKARCYGLDMQPLGGYRESSEPGTPVKIKVPNVDCIVMHSHLVG